MSSSKAQSHPLNEAYKKRASSIGYIEYQRRSSSMGHILKMRPDTEKTRNWCNKVGSNIRGGVNTLVQKLSNKEDTYCEPQGNITVDYLKSGKTREAYIGGFGGSDRLDVPEKNFSSSLVLRQLQEGKFTSILTLVQLPVTNGGVLVCGYRLEIFRDSPRSSSNTLI